MNTYKQLCNFYRHCIEFEGRTDMQCYTGTYKVREDTTLTDILEYFGGKLLYGVVSRFIPAEILFYVYEDEDGFYSDTANKFLIPEDTFTIEDVSGEKVHCWLIRD